MADRIEIQSHEPAGSQWTAMIKALRAGGSGPAGFVSLMLALCALVTCTELTDQDPARDGLVLAGLGIFLLVMAGNFVWLISHLHRVARSGAGEPHLEGIVSPAERLYRDVIDAAGFRIIGDAPPGDAASESDRGNV
jgi:hypothetical protein